MKTIVLFLTVLFSMLTASAQPMNGPFWNGGGSGGSNTNVLTFTNLTMTTVYTNTFGSAMFFMASFQMNGTAASPAAVQVIIYGTNGFQIPSQPQTPLLTSTNGCVLHLAVSIPAGDTFQITNANASIVAGSGSLTPVGAGAPGATTVASNITGNAATASSATNLVGPNGSIVNANSEGGYAPFKLGVYDGTLGAIFKNNGGVIGFVDDSSQNGYQFNLHRATAPRIYDNNVSIMPEQANHYIANIDNSNGVDSAQYFVGNGGSLDAQPMPFNELDARCPVPYFAYNTFLDPLSGSGGIKPTATNIQTAVMFYSTNLPAWMKPFTIMWIDGGWAHTNRVPSDNSIMVDSNSFPNGIQATIDMIHASNFLAGIYTTFSPINCAHPVDSGPTTTMGYLKQDVNQMMGYGIDAMKIDQCNSQPNGQNAENLMYLSFTYYAETYRGSTGSGKTPIMLYTVFPAQPGGLNDALAGSQMNVWENGIIYNTLQFSNLFNVYLPAHMTNQQYVRPGHFNEGPLSFEYVDTNLFAASVAVCGMLPSPLTVGALTNLAELYWATNSGAWTVMRDPACLPMFLLYSNNLTEVYVRPLGSKTTCQSNAVMLVNLDSGGAHNIGFAFTNTALTQPNWVKVNDVWTGTLIGAYAGTYTNSLAASSFQWVTLQNFQKPFVVTPLPLAVGGSATQIETVPGQPSPYIFGSRYVFNGLGNYMLPDPTPYQAGAVYGMTNIVFTMTYYFTDSVPVLNLHSELDIWTNSTSSRGVAWSSGTIVFITNPGTLGTNAYTMAMGIQVPSNILASAKAWGGYLYNNGTTNAWLLSGSITNY